MSTRRQNVQRFLVPVLADLMRKKRRRPLQLNIATLHPEFADFGTRVGDSVRNPNNGGIERVILIIGPRQIITRPPRWTDHVWVWAARWRDARLLGPRPNG